MGRRKKLSEMTPYERVDSRMDGMTWEEAEEVGIEIVARCMALHAYAREDGEEYFRSVMKRICTRADDWAHGEGTHILACARVGERIGKGNKDKTE